MNLHLEEIATQVMPNAVAVLICDGAGWHQKGVALKLPDNIVLLHLPPYAPELNPMEDVWDYLRGNKLSARVWDSYDAIVDDCRNAWNWLIDDPNGFAPLGPETGQRSISRAVGIISTQSVTISPHLQMQVAIIKRSVGRLSLSVTAFARRRFESFWGMSIHSD